MARRVVPTDHRGPKLALVFICGYMETAHGQLSIHHAPHPRLLACARDSGINILWQWLTDIAPQPLFLFAALLGLQDTGPSWSRATCVWNHKRNPASQPSNPFMSIRRLGEGDSFWTSPALKTPWPRPGPADGPAFAARPFLLFHESQSRTIFTSRD